MKGIHDSKELMLASILCYALAGCAGQAADQGEETTPDVVTPPPATDQEPVELVDLIPEEASGAVVLHVGRLRTSFRGPALIEVLRRVGGEVWERALDINLATNVRLAVIYSLPQPEGEPGDLSGVIDHARNGLHGLLIELEEPPPEGSRDCFPNQLAEDAPQLLPSPIPGVLRRDCGRMIISRREYPEVTVNAAEGSSASRAISSVLENGPQGLVLMLAVGPGMANRATCEGHEAPITGWQIGMIDMSEGLALRGRYHAASPDDVPHLEACVADGLGGLGGVPLFRQLELGDMLADGRVSADADHPGDVSLNVVFSFEQLETFMGLLELIGEGFVGDLFR